VLRGDLLRELVEIGHTLWTDFEPESQLCPVPGVVRVLDDDDASALVALDVGIRDLEAVAGGVVVDGQHTALSVLDHLGDVSLAVAVVGAEPHIVPSVFHLLEDVGLRLQEAHGSSLGQ
jgi:hypothetical protein